MSFEGAFTPIPKPEDIESKRKEMKTSIATKYGVSVEELDAFRRVEGDHDNRGQLRVLRGNVRGTFINCELAFENTPQEYKVLIDSGKAEGASRQQLTGVAAEQLYKHFEHMLDERDGLNQEASNQVYDSQLYETVASVAGEDVARSILTRGALALGA